MKLFYDIFDSKVKVVGCLHIFSSKKAIRAISFDAPVYEGVFDKHPFIQEVKIQLEEYFAGRRKKFELPLEPEGTEFQKRAWEILLEIPYGQTISYQAQAKKLGDSKKARAVGMANSKNPIPIVIPCHRVIYKDGTLGGFGAGVFRKATLLHLEQK